MSKVKPITNWDDLPIIMDAVLVSLLLGCSEGKVRRMARDGTLPAYKVGREIRFDRDELKTIIYQQRMKGA